MAGGGGKSHGRPAHLVSPEAHRQLTAVFQNIKTAYDLEKSLLDDSDCSPDMLAAAGDRLLEQYMQVLESPKAMVTTSPCVSCSAKRSSAKLRLKKRKLGDSQLSGTAPPAGDAKASEIGFGCVCVCVTRDVGGVIE